MKVSIREVPLHPLHLNRSDDSILVVHHAVFVLGVGNEFAALAIHHEIHILQWNLPDHVGSFSDISVTWKRPDRPQICKSAGEKTRRVMV